MKKLLFLLRIALKILPAAALACLAMYFLNADELLLGWLYRRRSQNAGATEEQKTPSLV